MIPPLLSDTFLTPLRLNRVYQLFQETINNLILKKKEKGIRIIEVGPEMFSRGTFYDRRQDSWWQKWGYPLHHSQKHQYQLIARPILYPKFFSKKGCYVYKRIDNDIRKK